MDTSLASEETHLIFSSDLGIDEWCNPASSFLGLQCLLARHTSDWYFLTGGQDHPIGDRGERDIFGNIFLGQVRGHWRDSGGGFTFPTPFACVYAVAFAQQCMSIKCSVLINFCGSCGETDLRFGVHFANNHIISGACGRDGKHWFLKQLCEVFYCEVLPYNMCTQPPCMYWAF